MIKTYSRTAKFSELKGYCPFAKDSDYVEVTDWYNGEGFDISVNDEKTISLTWGEWELIQKLVEHQAKSNTDYDHGYSLGYDIGYDTAIQELKDKKESKYSDKWHSGPVSDGGMDPRDRTIDYLSRCPRCGGPADNGHDREDPPNPYICSRCEVDIFATPG